MKKFYRSKENMVIAGICGGLSEITNIDPVLIRLGFLFAALVTGLLPLLITYIIGWIIIPYKDIPGTYNNV
ncbi:MAG: PspC domain-containing protein [Candidatus Dadabacteria bacterium]|nr:PspC domain-containing protein [Candidatus Dadabacteria bacterium]NIQ16682.1 PspC domain-containing protein [Candidatus Dadabacteria bacterium]